MPSGTLEAEQHLIVKIPIRSRATKWNVLVTAERKVEVNVLNFDDVDAFWEEDDFDSFLHCSSEKRTHTFAVRIPRQTRAVLLIINWSEHGTSYTYDIEED